MARVQRIFSARRTERIDGGKPGKVHGKLARAAEPADGALEFHEFLEAVVQLSFSRANPRCGEAGHENDAPAHPLPGCLEQMLTKSILKQAKQASLGKVKKIVEKSMELKATLRDLAPRLRREYERMLAPGNGSPTRGHMSGRLSDSRGLGGGGGARRGLSFEMLAAELSRRGLCKELKLRPTAAVTGTTLPEVRTHLAQRDVKCRDVKCRDVKCRDSRRVL